MHTTLASCLLILILLEMLFRWRRNNPLVSLMILRKWIGNSDSISRRRWSIIRHPRILFVIYRLQEKINMTTGDTILPGIKPTTNRILVVRTNNVWEGMAMGMDQVGMWSAPSDHHLSTSTRKTQKQKQARLCGILDWIRLWFSIWIGSATDRRCGDLRISYLWYGRLCTLSSRGIGECTVSPMGDQEASEQRIQSRNDDDPRTRQGDV